MVFFDGHRQVSDERVDQPDLTLTCNRLHYKGFFGEEGVTVVFLLCFRVSGGPLTRILPPRTEPDRAAHCTALQAQATGAVTAVATCASTWTGASSCASGIGLSPVSSIRANASTPGCT